MEITIAIKSLAKKRLTSQKIELPNLSTPITLAEFLTQLVSQQVQAFNQRVNQTDNPPLPLNDDYLSILTNTGKVAFADKDNLKQADESHAITTALQAYEDGLFAVFIDDTQIESLETTIDISKDSIVSFVRLTFLAGSFW